MQRSKTSTSTPTTTSITQPVDMHHTIISYRQDELRTTHQEYSTEADNDDEAAQAVRNLTAQGYTISSWMQRAKA